MFRNSLLLVVAAAAAASCSNASPSGSSPQGVADASTQGGNDSGASGNDSGATGDQDGAQGSDAPATSGVGLPFYVSDQFVPTGFMGDSTASMNAITLAHDATTCKSPRQPGAGGDCFTATWAPTLSGDAGSAWAGVYWQSPANNWGALPGKAIAPGATKVSFYAAGAQGGETIQVSVGGINANGANPNLKYGDTFSIKLPPITLTTNWTQYEIPLQGAQYTTVLGGFCWVVTSTASESITFYVDDIQWE
jgi:hypothetical protein